MFQRQLMQSLFAAMAALLAVPATAQEGDLQREYTGPVIDVHLHAASAGDNGPPGGSICVGVAANLRFTADRSWRERFTQLTMAPECEHVIVGPLTDQGVIDGTVAQMQQHDITGVLSARGDAFVTWDAAAPGRFLHGQALNIGAAEAPSADALSAAYDRGEFAVLAEVTNQYSGILADDPAMAAYWQMAEERGIPVGLHLGPGPPGSPALYGTYRLQSPLAMESVLRAHPRLRVYLMHAGYPFVDDLKAMLYAYPQLYVDTGVLQVAATRPDYHAFLEELVRAGFGDRIMFGSDQMNFPGLIGEGIDAINDAPFLSYEQKRAILHDNAARFFAPELERLRSISAD